MKQIVQNLKNGKTELIEIPVPKCNANSILIKTTKSLVSIGTEKMLVQFGKGSLISKVKQQPDKIKDVVSKIKTDGIIPTLKAVNNKLDKPIPLGYCNVGVVVDVGSNVLNFKVGDRVASNGAHAEYVVVSENLACKIPKNINDDEAVFTVIGSIGLQGIRLLSPNFGETVVVIGLGLIGLISCQILKANGCNVIGFDFDNNKVKLANTFGIDAKNLSTGMNHVKYVLGQTEDVGADGVLIAASNSSNEIISDCANMTRKQGKVVLVGVIGLDIKRSDFYEKEITFQVSCSYGPGRYDPTYENQNIDYPIHYVRWTENRNFNAILKAISNKSIVMKNLISRKIDFEDFNKVYDNINSIKDTAVIFNYNNNTQIEKNKISFFQKDFDDKLPIIGIIGAGNFTSSVILPSLVKNKVQIKTIASSKGLNGSLLAKKFKINESTTDYKLINLDNEINSVIISTQHNTHAKFICESIEYDKMVFVEKPLAINKLELTEIENKLAKSKGWITVGFNRRFSSLSAKLKEYLIDSPMNITITINAGYIPQDSWIQDMKIGGGRLIGEACHFIDLATYFTGSIVNKVCMNSMGVDSNLNSDNFSILLNYNNGSNVAINYFSNGSKNYSKERIEIFQNNSTFIIDNWKKLRAYGVKGFKSKYALQDKGHNNQFKKYLFNISNGRGSTISWDEIKNTTLVTFECLNSLKENKWISIR